MKFTRALIALLSFYFASTGVNADACQFTFKCQGSICERVLPSNCTSSTASSTLGAASTSNLSVSPFVSGSTEVVKSQDTLQSTPISGVGCAENGSCYGDISNINGMPKTNHVNGYFRRDGTYVRGHYRSSGKR